MKKMQLLLGILGLLAFPAVASAETVSIPDYPCEINFSEVSYQDSLYPLISYRNITYFPMTWDYCRALGLSSSWVEGKGLYIAYRPSGGELPVYETRRNARLNTASVPTYPIYINGREIDNRQAEYPLLNFRGVTYFPMTWQYAHEEFNWYTEWDGQKFILQSQNSTPYRSVSLEVYGVSGTEASVRRLRSETVLSDAASGTYTLNEQTDYFRYDLTNGSRTADAAGEAQYRAYLENRLWEERTAELKDGKITVGGEPLATVQALKKPDAAAENMTVSASVLQGNGQYELWHLTVCTDNAVPAPYTPREEFCYLHRLPENRWIPVTDNAKFIGLPDAMPDGDIYVNTVRCTGFRGNYNPAAELWRIGADGAVEKVNDRFPDYGSMKLIGKVEKNGAHVLKCEWAANYVPMDGTYDISPVNDGYFIFDGKKLTKIANYMYTDADFLNPESGALYGVISWKDEIRRLK